MRNMIICEGSTDGVLLQYFMREVHHWVDVDQPKSLFKNQAVWFRRLQKGSDLLDIISCKGTSKLLPCMEYLLELNKTATLNEAYQRVVIVTDRDEHGTESDFVESIYNSFIKNHISMVQELKHNEWISCEYKSFHNNRSRTMEVLLLVIPFEDNGAMETFLLNSIKKKDPYDACIIQQGNQFVDTVDVEKRYLTQRRYITKAKFDVYFSIRTSATQFHERQDIIKGVRWEDYIDIQGEFRKLEHLNDEKE